MRRIAEMGIFVGLFVLLGACGGPTETGGATPTGGSEAGVQDSVGSESADIVAARKAAVIDIVGAEAAERVMPKPGTLRPVYELESGDDTVFWLEPMEGFMVVGQRGSGVLPLDGETVRQQTASELFAKLAPGAVVPSELQALDRRVLEMQPVYAKLQAAKAQFPALHVAPVAPSDTDAIGGGMLTRTPDIRDSNGETLGKLSAPLTSEQCVSQKPCTNAESWTVIQKEVTATRTASHSDANFATGLGCAISGLITYSGRYRTWWSWTNWWSLDLSAGQMTTVWSRLASTDFDIEAKLSNFQAGDVGAQCANGF